MKYCAFDIVATPFGRDKALVYSRRSGATQVLTTSQVRLLFACATFKTPGDHARQGGVANETEGKEAVARQLQAFVDHGFLVAEADLRMEVTGLGRRPGEIKEATHTISSIGMLTRDRPEMLQRALTSYIDNTQRFARSPDFIIIDDAYEAATCAQNEQRLHAVRRTYGMDLYYADRRQRAHYAEVLARHADLSPALLRFALLGDTRCASSQGAARNTLLLHTAGEVTVQVDDDTVCRIAAAPDAETGMALTSRYDPNEWWFFRDHEAALNAQTFHEKDFLGLHEQLLGRTLRSCVGQITDPTEELDIYGISPPFLKHASAADARVRISYTGFVGDCSVQNRLSRFFYEGATHRRLIDPASAYHVNAGTRQIASATPRLTISNGAMCGTVNIGLDNRVLLPPFMPVLRTENLVFGKTLGLCFNEVYAGYLPYMLLHAPPEKQTPLPLRLGFSANSILLMVMSSFESWPRGSENVPNLRSLGRSLVDLGSLLLERFEETIRRLCLEMIHQRLLHLERRLDEHGGAPEAWLADVKACMSGLKTRATQKEICIPYDLAGSDDERLELLRELTATFGELLIHWPEIVEAAGALRAKGHYLAVSLGDQTRVAVPA